MEQYVNLSTVFPYGALTSSSSSLRLSVYRTEQPGLCLTNHIAAMLQIVSVICADILNVTLSIEPKHDNNLPTFFLISFEIFNHLYYHVMLKADGRGIAQFVCLLPLMLGRCLNHGGYLTK